MLRWLVCLALLAATPSFAEEAPAPVPATETAPAPAVATPATPAPATAEPAAPAADAPPGDFSLLRIDVEDGFALHPWLYHEFRLSELIGILGALHAQTPAVVNKVGSPAFAELDVGPNFHVGPLQINPQIGVDLGFSSDAAGGHTIASDVIPQLYVLFSLGRVNAEFWNMYFIPFDGSPHFYVGRLLANVRLVGGLALGPHMEWNWKRDFGQQLLAFGGDVLYSFRWGQVGLFAAYDRKNQVPVFRLTFLREL